MSIKFYDSNGKYWGEYDETRSLFIPSEEVLADRKTEPSGYNLSPVEDEPTISKMEQVDEPTTEDCSTVEPQYEMGMGTLKCDNCSEYGSFKCTKCDGEMYFKRLGPKDEPQTERSE